MKARRTTEQKLRQARKEIRALQKHELWLATRVADLEREARLNAEAINVLAKTNMRLQQALGIVHAGFPVSQPVSERPAVGEVVESFELRA